MIEKLELYIVVAVFLCSCGTKSAPEPQKTVLPEPDWPAVIINDDRGYVIRVDELAGNSWILVNNGNIPVWKLIPVSDEFASITEKGWLQNPNTSVLSENYIIIKDEKGRVILLDSLGNSTILVKDNKGLPIWKKIGCESGPLTNNDKGYLENPKISFNERKNQTSDEDLNIEPIDEWPDIERDWP